MKNGAERQSVDTEHPWPWLDAFTEAGRGFFNGRDADAEQLLRCVLAGPATVLFGKSGLGKTSLLQAGLAPLLRQRFLLPVLVRLNHDAGTGVSAQLLAALAAEARSRGLGWHGTVAPAGDPDSAVATLWELLHDTAVSLRDADGQRWLPVFVIDQFEEVFTLVADAAAQDVVFSELGDLIEGRIPPPVARRLQEHDELLDRIDADRLGARFVLSLREDFLPDLEVWADRIPRLGSNRSRLLPMTEGQALDAIRKTGGRLVQDEDAQRIVDFLGQQAGQGTNTPWRGKVKPAVEPALLSLVCAGLNQDRLEQRPPGTRLDTNDLQTRGSRLLEAFYDAGMAALPAARRAAAQALVERELITSTGTRRPYPRKDAERAGLSPGDLATLTEKRLLRIENTELGDYIELVHDRVAEVAALRATQARERAQRGAREAAMKARNARLLVVVALLLMPALLYSTVVQGPVFQRLALLVEAGTTANAASQTGPNGVGDEAPTLRSLVDAAALFDRGRTGADSALLRMNSQILDGLRAVPFIGQLADLIDQVAVVVEPTVNGKLRQLLASTVWKAPLHGAAADRRLAPARVLAGASCTVPRNRADEVVRGHLFTGTGHSNPRLGRSIFIPGASSGVVAAEDVEVFTARVDPDTGHCQAHEFIIRLPAFTAPDIVFDNNLQHMVFVNNEPGKVKTMTLWRIDWEGLDDEGGRSVRLLERAVLRSDADAMRLSRSARSEVDAGPGLRVLATERVTAGRALLVDAERWRIFEPAAQRIVGSRDEWRSLRPSAAGSTCRGLMLELEPQPGFELNAYEDDEDSMHCFVMQRGSPPQDPAAAIASRLEVVTVAVYAKPLSDRSDEGGAPTPIASLPGFMRVRPAEVVGWAVGLATSPFGGWIAGWGPDSTGAPRALAAPWSTCALWRIGSEVLSEQSQEQLRTARDERNRDVCRGK